MNVVTHLNTTLPFQWPGKAMYLIQRH